MSWLVAVGGFIVGFVGGVVNVGLKCYVEGSFSPPSRHDEDICNTNLCIYFVTINGTVHINDEYKKVA